MPVELRQKPGDGLRLHFVVKQPPAKEISQLVDTLEDGGRRLVHEYLFYEYLFSKSYNVAKQGNAHQTTKTDSMVR